MPSPPLKKFCFCANLEVGCVVVGCVQGAYYVITLIGTLFLLGLRHDIQEVFVEVAKEEGADHRQFESIEAVIAGVLWPIIIFRVIGLATSVCLIVGSQKRNKFLLLPYLILEGIAFVLLVILWLFMVPGRGTKPGGFGFFLLVTLYLALNKYFWLVALSLYILISNEQRQQPYNGDAMIPLQTIPENQRMYIPANNAYPQQQQQQQPLYIPQPINAYPQQQMSPNRNPPPYPVQTYYQAPLPEKV